MLFGEGVFKRQCKGLGYWARVSLEVDINAKEPYVNMLCNGTGFYSQGDIEEATANGYVDWKRGAMEGIKYALELCSHSNYGISIKKIEGLTSDTNPTLVSIATAYAIWNAIGYHVSDEVIKKLEEKALNSWKLPHDQVCKLE